MTENKRFHIDNENDIIEFDWENNEYIDDFMWSDGKSWDRICNRLNELSDENENLKQQIDYLIRELKTEMETSISKNERIRLDFAITVLESLKR